MTAEPAPERWRRVEALFYEALERQPDSRAAFLEQACGGNADLRREVEELLAHTDVTLAEIRRPVDEALRQFSPHGQQIGPFRLVRLLGEGGMGAVYLAERADDEYRQQVAIKLMRAGLVQDSDMLRRFRAERQILADLNHPYIARLLHGGTTPQGSPYLVMEYIAGVAIDKYCAERAVSVDDRLRLFLKVCAAVEYAHLNRVIHRDLKPGNILVTSGGEPKLLDFGIAKLWDPGSGERGAADTRVTGGFMTPEYASPEQVRGETLNAATDIYSLGTVLYELLTGQHPFAAERRSPIELGRHICETEPAPPSRVVRSKLAPGLDRVVLTAMRKNPRERYGSVTEFADRVRAYLDEQPAVRSRLAVRFKPAAIIALVVLAAIGAALYLANRPNHTAATFNSMQITRMTTRGNVAAAAISPDGKFIAYVLDQDNRQSLWVTELATNSDLRIAGPETGAHRSLGFSADGTYLYYVRQSGYSQNTLYRLPILGGEPRPVFADVGRSVALAPDGKQFAFLRVDPKQGEAAVVVANLDGTGAHNVALRRRPAYFAPLGLAWSPDGSSIACFAGDASYYTPEAFRMITVHVSDGRERPLTRRAWVVSGQLSWLGDGNGMIATASDQLDEGFQIWHAAYPGGDVRRVTNDLGNYTDLGTTIDGRTMVAVDTEEAAGIWVAPLSGGAPATPVSPLAMHGTGTIAWDAEGGILYSAADGESRNIWRIGPQGGPARPVTSAPGYKNEVAATPDGRYILYDSAGKVWRVNSTGDQPRQLTAGALDVHPAASADSRWVYYGSFHNWSPSIGGKPTIWKVPIDGGESVQVVEEASSMPQVSPDGKLLAYLADNPGGRPAGIRVMELAGGMQVGAYDIPLQVVRWSPDSKSLIYQKEDRGVGNLWRQPTHGGPATQLTSFTSDRILDFDVARDGRVAISRAQPRSNVVLIRNFR